MPNLMCVCVPLPSSSLLPSLSPCPLLLLNETGSHDATLAALNSHSVARLAFKSLGSRHSLLSGGMLPRSAATFFSIQTQLKVFATKGWRVSVGCSLSIFWKQSLFFTSSLLIQDDALIDFQMQGSPSLLV